MRPELNFGKRIKLKCDRCGRESEKTTRDELVGGGWVWTELDTDKGKIRIVNCQDCFDEREFTEKVEKTILEIQGEN